MFRSLFKRGTGDSSGNGLKEVWIGVGALVLVGGLIALTIYGTASQVTPEITVDDSGIEVEVVLRHPLTGEILSEELESLPQVFGVMVENSADAWPLSGIDEAFLVIEAPVEGTIPRFVTFFMEGTEVEKVGPVRSARPYYLDWNDELQGVYAHVGGSPEALDYIKYDYDTIDLNQFWQSEYFYRQNGYRYAPHNVYTTGELLNESLNELDLDDPNYESWTFKDDSPVNIEDARSLSIDWSDGATYDVEWHYNFETNDYTRYQSRYVMEMENDNTVEANNVIVMSADIRVIDNVGRRNIATVGQGDALIAQDGEMYLARWVKEERTGRLRFFTTDGFEISLNAGTTWIEVVDDLGVVETMEVELDE
ncbi:MAG: DUF3048 domain-containing protein [Candidatus Uhrbacteria bacterium]|nr:DUF3048 domain-containing protein [Candidatus Uhrbacteria bacterium]